MRDSAIVALGNVGDPAAVEALGAVLGAEDSDERLRAYSAWALGRLATERSRELLEAARASERDPAVAAEIEAALAAE
jgi:HEAT repeat protein